MKTEINLIMFLLTFFLSKYFYSNIDNKEFSFKHFMTSIFM